MELQPGACSDTSVIAYVAAVEESRPIELVRGPVIKYPFGLALLEAQRQLVGKWEQRRDLMYTNQTRARTTMLAPTQPSNTPKVKSKGSGKNLKDGKLTKVKEEDSGRPLQLRERGQNNEKAKLITVNKWQKKDTCKAWNDSRGCEAWCPQQREHRCDIRLERSGLACGSRSHNRLQHDARQHGQPASHK